jgi:hypothetical protein
MPESIAVAVDPPRVKVKPDEQATATVTIRNRSEDVEYYSLSVEGELADWARITPDQVPAFPHETIRAQLVLHAPLDAHGGTYHVTIRAVARTQAGVDGLALLEVEVPAPAASPVASRQPVVRPMRLTSSEIEVSADPVQNENLPRTAAQWRLHIRNARLCSIPLVSPSLGSNLSQ